MRRVAERMLRSNREKPSSVSNFRICFDSVDCVVFTFSAASKKVSDSTAAIKKSSCSNVIGNTPFLLYRSILAQITNHSNMETVACENRIDLLK